MRLTTFSSGGTSHTGVVDAGVAVSLGLASGGDPRFASLLALVRGGDSALADARELAVSHPVRAAYDVDDVTVRAPLPVPTGVRHWTRTGAAEAAAPDTPAKGPGDPVTPNADGRVAVAIAAVVDSSARIFGCTVLGGAQGPFVVTVDALDPDLARVVEVRVNGVHHARSAVPDARGHLDRAFAGLGAIRPLRAGELVVVDLTADLPPGQCVLRDGDEIELEVTGLGVLRNRIQILP
ncbi:fumarylacetoacetate hydrolase family protein [Nocardioides nitrophenolicus]|uniref:fumarylacetoacetate hydrolase family protein n=1 Tax=Nocardioides nitrophenolicus TaxID=60489 RepID=UPI0019599A5D|nr:fumarylacetoacetate hydrolase family protein [Nocardioides nitrophenolicus]MBM7518585.1 hypothetical protein [Nocardioides nitrophenolicus]